MTIPENQRLTDWLAREKPEAVLEPELPIVDPHHHLWDLRKLTTQPFLSFEQKVYLCEELSEEVATSGHNVVQTVFAQCVAFYRADGPEAFRCVGETEFVNGIAAMSRSGLYGPTRLCTGIFSAADLRAGRDVSSKSFKRISSRRLTFAGFAVRCHGTLRERSWTDTASLRNMG